MSCATNPWRYENALRHLVLDGHVNQQLVDDYLNTVDVSFEVMGEVFDSPAFDRTRDAIKAVPEKDGKQGYVDAFYEVCDLLDIPAMTITPKKAWETVIRPKLAALCKTANTSKQAAGEAVAIEWPPRAMKGEDGIKLSGGKEFLPLFAIPERVIDEAGVWNRCLDECQRAYEESFKSSRAPYPYDPANLAKWLRVHYRGMWEKPATRIPEIVWIYETLLRLPLSTTPPRHPADEVRDATCGHCRGTGEVPRLVQHASGDPQDAYEAPSDCPSCGGTGAVTAVSSEQCVAIYDAVMRSGMTRDVKTPERKTEIVRAALQAGTP